MPTGACQPSCCWRWQNQGLDIPKPACLAEIPAGTAAPGAKNSTRGGLGVAGLCLPPAVVVLGKGWPCCAEHGSKACGSLVSLCGIIAACPLMELFFQDRLDVPPAQAGHRPLSHTALPQHPTRVLRWDTEQSQAVHQHWQQEPCYPTVNSQLQAQGKWGPWHPLPRQWWQQDTNQRCSPHPRAAMEPWAGLGAGNSSSIYDPAMALRGS